jgi:uncharacterized tellurite resistance protein B-like protein
MFGFFERQYLSYKKNHVRNLLLLAKADGHLHQQELDFIHKAAEKIGLKNHHLDTILKEPSTKAYKLPEKYHQKLSTLHDIVAITLADGVIEPSELELCKAMATSLQFKPEVIDMLLEAFENEIPSVEEWEQIKKKAKSYYSGS